MPWYGTLAIGWLLASVLAAAGWHRWVTWHKERGL